MDRVKIRLKKGKATIVEGGDTFIGKLLSSAGEIKVNVPRGRGTYKLAKK